MGLIAKIWSWLLSPAPVYGPPKPKPQFGPPVPAGFKTDAQIEAEAFELSKAKIKSAEGYRLDVYVDKLGKLTVGIGHRVLAKDGLKKGMRITAAQADAFFKSDIARAFSAAKLQARTIKKYTPEMIAALASVNFQMGTAWTDKFYNTWDYMVDGNIKKAIKGIKASLWHTQTADRAEALIATLQSEFNVA